MAIYFLSPETLPVVTLSSEAKHHKFITTPRHIIFGDAQEFHDDLLDHFKGCANELSVAVEAFKAEKRRAFGYHMKTAELGVIDGGMMTVEAEQGGTVVGFHGGSETYGEGEQERTRFVGERLLQDGAWKLHIPTAST